MNINIVTRIAFIVFLGLGIVISVLFFFYLYYYIRLLKKDDVGPRFQTITKLIIGLSIIWFIVILIGIWSHH